MRITLNHAKFSASRSSKPGGMNVDHRSTKIHMWVRVDELPFDSHEKQMLRKKLAHHINQDDEIWVECQETRSQETNRDLALAHLNKLIEDALKEPPLRVPNEPPLNAEDIRIHDKKKVSEKKRGRREGHIPHGNS